MFAVLSMFLHVALLGFACCVWFHNVLFTVYIAVFTYFFGYKMEFFSFQNKPKNLDPSYKMDLDLLGSFRKGENHIISQFHRTVLVTCSHSREGNPVL